MDIQEGQASGQMEMETEVNANKAVVLRFNREFMEKGNTEVLKELVDDDFVNHTAAGSFSKNVAGLIAFSEVLHGGFSDLKVIIHEQIGQGDVVASRKTILATHTGLIMGHPGTGKTVEIKVMDFVRLKGGKYLEHWGQNNLMQVIENL